MQREETRNGQIFHAKFKKEKSGFMSVEIFVDEKSVGVITTEEDSQVKMLDQAFHAWVFEGIYLQTVEDPSLRSILACVQREKQEGVPWNRKTFRFLIAKGNYEFDDPHFILTTDKSDLRECDR